MSPRASFRGHVLVASLALLCVASTAAAQCLPEPARLDRAGFALATSDSPPGPEAELAPVELPDVWRKRRPDAGGFAWYRFDVPATPDGDERCAVFLPDVNMNAAVFVNGQWIGDGGSLEKPVAHNFNRPLYFTFPGELLRGGGRIDVLLYAYAHHFGRLAPIWVGPNAVLEKRYERAYFRQVTLAQIGTVMAIVTVLLVGTIWVGSGFQQVYGFFVASTGAWAVSSLNYWVSDIPVSHWTWDRLVNGALDQFAVFLALFFHRLLGVRRRGVERALAAFSVVTPRPWFATAMMGTHAAITMIGAYVTALAWVHRARLTRLEARVYLGAWLLQLGSAPTTSASSWGCGAGSATRCPTPCRA